MESGLRSDSVCACRQFKYPSMRLVLPAVQQPDSDPKPAVRRPPLPVASAHQTLSRRQINLPNKILTSQTSIFQTIAQIMTV